MKTKSVLLAGISFLLVPGSLTLAATEPNAEERVEAPTKQELLAGTIRRYFESSGSIQNDGLLTRSQIRGLQQYLRRVGRGGQVSHPAIVNRVLPDRSRLAQLYYKKRGAAVLQKSADKLGGFHQLDMLSRETVGMLAIQEALVEGDHRKLVEYALSRPKKTEDAQESTEQAEDEKTAPAETPEQFRRIYTVDEFIAAVTSAGK